MTTSLDPASMTSVIPAGVPPGLEFLLPLNQIIVKEVRKGIFSTIYSAKEYDIFDAWGHRIYSASETSHDGCCNSGKHRNWNIEIFNCMGKPVISGVRTGGGCCEYNQVLVTSKPSGRNLGDVSEIPGMFGTSWNILNGSGAPVLLLDAPLFTGGLFEREFPLYYLSEPEPRKEHGIITKKFTGFFAREDVFGVRLPVSLDVKLKAVLIYATFLIDFQFYQDR